MSLFSFGGVILDMLLMVFEAWNSMVDIVFGLLMASPENFKDGGPWQIIEEINPIFVAVGSSLVVIFFVIGFCSESIDVKEEMRLEKIHLSISWKSRSVIKPWKRRTLKDDERCSRSHRRFRIL